MEAIADDSKFQNLITEALENGDASYLSFFYKIKPMEFAYQAKDEKEIKFFFKNQCGPIPLQLSTNQKTRAFTRLL